MGNAVLRCFLPRRVSLQRTESLAKEMLFNVLATEEQRRERLCPDTTSSGLLSPMSMSWLVAVAFRLRDRELGVTRLLRDVLMMDARDMLWGWEYAYFFRRMYRSGCGGVFLVAPTKETVDPAHSRVRLFVRHSCFMESSRYVALVEMSRCWSTR